MIVWRPVEFATCWLCAATDWGRRRRHRQQGTCQVAAVMRKCGRFAARQALEHCGVLGPAVTQLAATRVPAHAPDM
jgi:hypothetical protein